MNDKKGDKPVNVTDRPVEVQGLVQSVLTFLLLAVMSWVGLTLEKVKDNTSKNHTSIALIAQQVQTVVARHDESIRRVERTMREHVSDPRAHK